jgi:hypothetical protein
MSDVVGREHNVHGHLISVLRISCHKCRLSGSYSQLSWR